MQLVLFTALMALNCLLILGWLIVVIVPIVSIGLIFVLNLFPFLFDGMKSHVFEGKCRQVEQASCLASQSAGALLHGKEAPFVYAQRKPPTGERTGPIGRFRLV